MSELRQTFAPQAIAPTEADEREERQREAAEPRFTFAAQVERASVNEAARTFEVVWYAGNPVMRFSWDHGPYVLRLSMEDKAIRMGRLQARAPLLNSHSRYSLSSVLGVVEHAEVKGGKGHATVRLSNRKSEDVDGIWQDLKDGVLNAISVGFTIHDYEDTPADEKKGRLMERLATDWEPEELSLVPIGADPGARVRELSAQEYEGRTIELALREGFALKPGKEASMPPIETPTTNPAANAQQLAAQTPPSQAVQPPAAAAAPSADALAAARTEGARLERERLSAIDQASSVLGFQANDPFVVTLRAATGTPDQAREALTVEAFKRQQATSTNGMQASGAQVGVAEYEKVKIGIGFALEQKLGLKVDPKDDPHGVREAFRYCRLLDLRRELLIAQGKQRHALRALSPDALMREAFAGSMSTSDFPLLLANVANKRLQATFQGQKRTFLPFSGQRNLPDFKDAKVVRLGGMSVLEEVGEKAQFERASVGEKGETWSLTTYGKILSLTRQAYINDDLGGFGNFLKQIARGVANLENNLVWALFTGNVTMGDGVALFHATHANVGTQALDLDGLAELYKIMGSQVDISPDAGVSTGEFLNIEPKFLVCTPTNIHAGLQYTSTINPNEGGKVNPYAGRLTPIMEPRLATLGDNYWLGIADPSEYPSITFGYLEGQEGPRVEVREGFETDGTDVKVAHDFGCLAEEWVSMFRSTGAA